MPDGKIITTDSDVSNLTDTTSTIKIWNLEDSRSELIGTIPTIVFIIELVGNGKYLAVATQNNCDTCNTTSNVNHDYGSIYLYLLNDPTQFFVLGDTGLPNEQDLSDYPGYFHTDTVNNLKSINDHMFASGSRDKTVKVWDLRVFSDENAPVAPLTFTCLGKVNGLDYDEDAQLLILGSYDGSINSYSMEQEVDHHHKHEHHEHYQYGTLLESYNSGQGVLFVMVGDFSGNDDKI
jgi:WD40 repeat protein